MIDSHCHLNFPNLSENLSNILKKCKINGVTKSKVDIEFKLGKLSIYIDEKNFIHM